VRKTFHLDIDGKNRDRLLDACKHDIRRYVKRERGRRLPPGVDFWDFACRFGPDEASAEPVHFGDLLKKVDMAAADGANQFYVELQTRHGQRKPRAEPDASAPQMLTPQN
jgi:Family of unknown function (DUF6172)